MASIELNMDNIEGIENLTPLEAQCRSPQKNAPPLDFSQLTPSQLGISIQSFSPSSNCKDKSRLAQLKLKRRSNVGVRGSPETNSLIRYIAQQRMKTPPTTPTYIQASPFHARASSALKQKMASFQSLMDVEENEMPETVPRRQDSQMGGCIKARDYLSDGRSCDGGKENTGPVSGPPLMTPPPNKRRCTGPLKECVEQIREANSPVLKCTALKKQEVTALLREKDQLPQTLTPRAQPQEAAHIEHTLVSLSPPLSPLSQTTAWEPRSTPLKHCTPSEEQQDSLEHQSPSLAVVEDTGPSRASQPPPFAAPSLLEMNPTDEADSSGHSTVKKKKTVRFGEVLPPEFFDKNLPPSTPLLKGGTPARVSTSAGGSQLRSLLKTPQRYEPTLYQPDFGSPSLTGASPLISMAPRCSIALRRGEESPGTHEKIIFPSMEEEVDSLLMDNAEVDCETEPLDLNAAFFQEDSMTEALSDAAPEPASAPEPAPVLDPEPAPAPEPAPVLAPESEPVSSAAAAASSSSSSPPPPPPARSRSRKRKKPEEAECVKKRSTRTAAKCASGKMKKTSTRKCGWGSKEVNHSLYGKREYASKNPLLSPITETQSSASRSPTPQQPRTKKRTAKEADPGPLLPLGEAINSDPTTNVVMAAALWRSPCHPAMENSMLDELDAHETDPNSAAVDASHGLSEVREAPMDPTTTTSDSTGKAAAAAARPGRRRSGPKTSRAEPGRRVGRGSRGRTGGKGRKVSVPADDWLSEEPEDQGENGDGGEAEERIQGPTTTTTTTNPEVLVSSPPKDTVAGDDEAEQNAPCPSAPVDSQRADTPSDHDTDRREEVQAGADTRDAPCPPADVDATVSLPERKSVNRVKQRPSKGEQKGTRSRGRRSSLYISSVVEEREEETPQSEPLTGEGVEEREREQREHTASQVDSERGSEMQEGPEQGSSYPDHLVLPHWQQEFDIDDVLRPLPTRGHRSVRRSLRNMNTLDLSDSGLAWMPHTSPDSIRAVRRKTRGRRSSTLPLHPPLMEEQDL